MLHVASITTHTHDRRKSIGEKKQRKEKNIKETLQDYNNWHTRKIIVEKKMVLVRSTRTVS